jgi:hypothetical protein
MSSISDYQIKINNPGVGVFVVAIVMPGNWHFALTVYESPDRESVHLNDIFRNYI